MADATSEVLGRVGKHLMYWSEPEDFIGKSRFLLFIICVSATIQSSYCLAQHF